MPYQTGTAEGPNDLLYKIVEWLKALGWEEQRAGLSGTDFIAHVSKNDMFVHMRTTMGNVTPWAHGHEGTSSSSQPAALHLYVGTGYSSGANWNAQPGGPKGNNQTYTVGVAAQLNLEPIGLYGFYSDTEDNICIVFEGRPGVISHIGWGRLDKVGVWTGGEYFFGALAGYAFRYTAAKTPGKDMHSDCPAAQNVHAAALVRADVDTFIGKWLGVGSSTYPERGYTGMNAASSVVGDGKPPVDIASYSGLDSRATNQAVLTAALLPVKLWAPRPGSGYSLLGDIPNVFFSSAANAPLSLQIGSVIKYGADEYALYPNFAVKRVP